MTRTSQGDISTDNSVDNVNSPEKYLQKFVKQMLQTRIFLGHFQEKRYVENLHTYRDVVVISESEKQLKSDIGVIRKKLKNFYPNCWIGMTCPGIIGAPNGHCFWIESQNMTFGSYWYAIKSIRYFENEVLIRLKVIRAMDDRDTIDVSSSQTKTELISDIQNRLPDFSSVCSEMMNLLTVNNIKEAITFTFVLLVTGVALFVKGLGYMMEYSLKFMREVSIFIQSSTPVLIAFVNMIGKVIGGLYILIAMMWKGNSAPPDRRPYIYNQRVRAIEMPRRQPIITEIE